MKKKYTTPWMRAIRIDPSNILASSPHMGASGTPGEDADSKGGRYGGEWQ